ncbi:MAG: hypothetical protein IJH40_08585 [Ruminococcus sp.]|uniref:hypothetical protein n=1 Tax=Ruminococcus sp. TaxID=41978 RepID=UPI002872D399|nr:hypothetical protein [Ruminococcus sp.]MBQ3285682.1 hypothetical protein [Ruminococcus sp.]
MLSFEDRIKIAADLLKIPENTARECSYCPEECDGIFISVPGKGRGSVMIDPEGKYLMLPSFYGFDDYLEKYLAGERSEFESD